MVVESVDRWMVIQMEWEEVDGWESRERMVAPVFKNNLTKQFKSRAPLTVSFNVGTPGTSYFRRQQN